MCCTWMCPSTHRSVNVCVYSFTYAFMDLFSSTVCCTACAHYCFLLLSSAGDERRGREEESCWLSHRYLKHRVGQCAMRRLKLTCVRCQHQATATEAYNWANAISWPLHWTLVSFVTIVKLRLISSRAVRNRKSDGQLFGKPYPGRLLRTL